MIKNEKLWKIVHNAWKNGIDNSGEVSKYNNYWEGMLTKKISMSKFFDDDFKSSCNVCQPIIETKVMSLLDAQFTINVLPKLTSINSIQNIKNQQKVSDILHSELKNIFHNNKIDTIKEIVARWGHIAGYGAAQVLWDITNDVKGEIAISQIDPTNLRWDKNAKNAISSAFFSYPMKESPMSVKDKYCKNEDGSYNIEKCELVDKLTVCADSEKGDKTGSGAVINYSGDGVAGQAYADNGNGIQTNKQVELIIIFLKDDSLYSPEQDDNSQDKEVKEQYVKRYPNGRMVIFSKNEEHKIIFEDVELPESFNGLGNIEIFNPLSWNGIKGHSEISDLIPIQNRINGSYYKLRLCIANDITTIAVNRDSGLKEGDFVQYPIVFTESKDESQILSNNGIEKGLRLLELINILKSQAFESSRVNETMVYGARQTGTTSANQVEALQESPMTNIRNSQRNFKDFMIGLSEKCINLIVNNYNMDRMIKLANNNTGSAYAQFSVQVDQADGKEKKVITLFDKDGQQTEEPIEFKEDWEFSVEVSAGTEIPRTRRENVKLMDQLIDRGIIDLKDVDMIEMYLRAQDIPNYRVIVDLIRERRKQQEEQENSPESNNWTELMKNPDAAKSISEFIKAISGYSKAKQMILNEIGLDSEPGKLDDSPAQELTKESDVAEVVTMNPGIVSSDPIAQQNAYNAAVAEQLTDTL